MSVAETENKIPKKDGKKRMVKALFCYNPENSDELQLKVNDILEVIEETEEGWWKGILDGQTGMFPSNFVIELDGLPEEFNNQLMNELSPAKNVTKGKIVAHQEPVHGINHSPSNKVDARQVYLNSSSVENLDAPKCPPDPDKKTSIMTKKITTETPAPRLPPKPVREQARVMFAYTAQNEDELTLKEGDIITVISKEIEDKGWWKGELNNRVGVFPDNFVQLIKVEEQKKPERPNKPAVALSSKASLKASPLEKATSESSPKVEKKLSKTPPVKPPPPELHKREPERPPPPHPNKKPSVPHPLKKPARSSLESKLPGFSPPTSASPVKSPVSENSPSTFPVLSETKTEERPKIPEKKFDKEEKTDKRDELGFDAIESSERKLVHLTANRAKAPNRRPPSHIFLKENEKDTTVTDSRRLSEPLLSEMKLILQDGEIDLQKVNSISNKEVKSKVPPTRPSPPNIKSNKPSGFSPKIISTEESIMKHQEVSKSLTVKDSKEVYRRHTLQDSKLQEIQKCHVLQNSKSQEASKSQIFQDSKLQISKSRILQESSLQEVSKSQSFQDSRLQDISKSHDSVPQNEVSELKTAELPLNSFNVSNTSTTDLDIISENLKTVMSTMVSQVAYNELLNQVKELKDTLESYNSACNKAIKELREELEEEKKLRKAVELELQHLKESQTIQ